ncbi:hypothetical protein PF001_g33430 [Phytophthora fragariae]|nr:hypothetical protein PF001_g33430 [Phytophthora fragariae]
MYLACGTRPDISVAVAKLSRFLENPGEKPWDAGIKVVRYLLKTKDVGIVYDGLLGTQLEAYSVGRQSWRPTLGERDATDAMRCSCGVALDVPENCRSEFNRSRIHGAE